MRSAANKLLCTKEWPKYFSSILVFLYIFIYLHMYSYIYTHTLKTHFHRKMERLLKFWEYCGTVPHKRFSSSVTRKMALFIVYKYYVNYQLLWRWFGPLHLFLFIDKRGIKISCFLPLFWYVLRRNLQNKCHTNVFEVLKQK